MKSTDKNEKVVVEQIVYHTGELQLLADGVKIIDHPHKLKPSQIADLNKALSSLVKYEEVLKGFHLATMIIFDRWLDEGQAPNTKNALMAKAIIQIHNALLPVDGFYDTYRGLTGPWNKDLSAFERYR